jgi:hypothetical protein
VYRAISKQMLVRFLFCLPKFSGEWQVDEEEREDV